MLRRVETMNSATEPDAAATSGAPAQGYASAANQGAASGADRRRHPRVKVEVNKDPAPNFERRKQERRSMDALRNEMQWVIAAEYSKTGFALPRLFGLKPSRFFLLVVAILAGASAAYLATQGDRAATVPVVAANVEAAAPAAPALATVPVLVAKADIGVGDKLTASTMGWEDWPEKSVHADFLTQTGNAEAITNLAGSMTREIIRAGEPITSDKLIQSAPGYLSAVLGGGMRAVSVSVTAAAASGGFLNPGDHVDVVLTRTSNNEMQASTPRTETVVRNVRVLAINSRLGRPDAAADPDGLSKDMFSGQAMATLALDPKQAEIVVNASAIGNLSLVLRSVADFTGVDAHGDDAVNQAIRLSSPFWTNN